MSTRYFLGSIVDKKLRNSARDNFRTLVKLKRNLELKELDQLYFSHKYLGEDLPGDVISDIKLGLENWLNSMAITIFTHGLGRIEIGKKSELVPGKIFQRLTEDSSLKMLQRALHKVCFESAPAYVVKRKDETRLLGVINYGGIKRNTSPSVRIEIIKHLRLLPFPNEVLVDNLCIIARTPTRQGVKQQIIQRIMLRNHGNK